MTEMNTQQALARIEQPQIMALDAIGRRAAIDELVNKTLLVQEAMKAVMHEGEHFGKIPGCGDKPALLKAGAEKLGMTFRLKASFEVDERQLPNNHREYSVKCILSDGNMGVGSCTTMESKYRFRGGERKCPDCGKATIIVGKKEFGGGFLCFAKKGGCGAKFADDDKRITEQQIGKVEHDNPADFYNTCLKMAKKRAHVDAIITATACSDIFTQDIEEMPAASVSTEAPAPSAPAPNLPPTKAEPKPVGKPASLTHPGSGEESFPVVTVLTVKEVHSKPDAPKKWTAYFIRFSDGFGEMEAATFDKKIADLANDLANTGENAVLVVKPGKKPDTKEIVRLTRSGEPSEVQDQVPMDFDSQGNPVEAGVTP